MIDKTVLPGTVSALDFSRNHRFRAHFSTWANSPSRANMDKYSSSEVLWSGDEHGAASKHLQSFFRYCRQNQPSEHIQQVNFSNLFAVWEFQHFTEERALKQTNLHWSILQARFGTWVTFCEERPYVPNLITCSTGGATIQHPLAMYLSSTQITRFGCFSAFQIKCRIQKTICKFSQDSQAHSLTCFAFLAETDQSGLPHSGGHHGDRPLRQPSTLLFLIEAIIKQFLSENCLPKIDC